MLFPFNEATTKCMKDMEAMSLMGVACTEPSIFASIVSEVKVREKASIADMKRFRAENSRKTKGGGKGATAGKGTGAGGAGGVGLGGSQDGGDAAAAAGDDPVQGSGMNVARSRHRMHQSLKMGAQRRAMQSPARGQETSAANGGGGGEGGPGGGGGGGGDTGGAVCTQTSYVPTKLTSCSPAPGS